MLARINVRHVGPVSGYWENCVHVPKGVAGESLSPGQR
jgi:hypothetical protein